MRHTFQSPRGSGEASKLQSIEESKSPTDCSKASSDDKLNSTSLLDNNADIFQIIEEDRRQYEGDSFTNNDQHAHYDNGAAIPPMEAFQNEAPPMDEEIKHKDKIDSDEEGPIIYAHHDDDSISQITSSIAGNSVYGLDYTFSTFPSSQQKLQLNSYVEIPEPALAPLSNESSNSDSSEKQSQKSNASQKGFSAEHLEEGRIEEDLEDFFGPTDQMDPCSEDSRDKPNFISQPLEKNLEEETDPGDQRGVDIVNVYASDYTYTSQPNHFIPSDEITLNDMYSVSQTEDHTQSQPLKEWLQAGSNTNQSSNDDLPLFLQKSRNLVNKIKTAVSQTKNYIRGHNTFDHQKKKDDDLDARSTSDETDYFGLLMSTSFTSNSSQPISPYSDRHYRKEKLRNTAWTICFVIIVWLLLHLAKTGNDAAFAQNRRFRKMATSDKKESSEGEVNTSIGNVIPSGTVIDAHVVSATTLSEASDTNTADVRQFLKSGDEGTLPGAIERFADVTDVHLETDIPFFWHIPRSGGATMNDILGKSFHLRLASHAGGVGLHSTDDSLQLLNLDDGISYVNVDVSSAMGIERAVQMNLATSGLADVVITSLLYESSRLFKLETRARMFSMFRHPVDRAVSLFHYLQDTQWKAQETFNQELSNISLDDFYHRRLAESNWQVRYLTNQLTKGAVDEDDLNLAKEIVRRKCVVGLFTEKKESLTRFQRYFNMKLISESDRDELDRNIAFDWPMRHLHDQLEEGSEIWNLIASYNSYDMQLHEYVNEIYKEQVILFQ